MEMDLLLRAVLGPAALSALALLALRAVATWLERPRAAGDAASERRRAGIARVLRSPRWMALLLIAPLLGAYAHQEGAVEWPPHIAFGWLPVALAFAAPLVWCLGGARSVGGCAIAAIVTALCCCAMLAPPGMAHPGDRLAAALTIAVAGTAFALVAARGGAATFVGMWGSAACLSAMALLAGIVKLAVMLGATSAACAMLAVVAGFAPRTAAHTAGAIAFAAVLGCSAFVGAGYDEQGIPLGAWIVAALAPAAAAIALVPSVMRKPRLAALVRAGAPIVIAAGALLAGAWASGAFSVRATPGQYDQQERDFYR